MLVETNQGKTMNLFCYVTISFDFYIVVDHIDVQRY